MANTYYNTTGVLHLERVTPVIRALFGHLELDPTYPGNGQTYIADLAEQTNNSWSEVLKGVRELLIKKGKIPSESLTNGDEDDEYIVAVGKENIQKLGELINLDGSLKLPALLAQIELDNSPGLVELFRLAELLDDGHGLTACNVQSSWHCSKPKIGEFGGSGEFIGKHAHTASTSYQAESLGLALEAALSSPENSVTAAACVIQTKLSMMLLSIQDDTVRAAVTAQLVDQLNQALPVQVDAAADAPSN